MSALFESLIVVYSFRSVPELKHKERSSNVWKALTQSEEGIEGINYKYLVEKEIYRKATDLIRMHTRHYIWVFSIGINGKGSLLVKVGDIVTY